MAEDGQGFLQYLLGGTSRLYGYLTGRNARMREAVAMIERKEQKIMVEPANGSVSSFSASESGYHDPSMSHHLSFREAFLELLFPFVAQVSHGEEKLGSHCCRQEIFCLLSLLAKKIFTACNC
eukprot:s174_g8.t1